ncbi:MAG: ABC transporter permease [Acidobacteria bacterium]|nr:ABC transporter permease [Acidobacteriota bacterium]
MAASKPDHSAAAPLAAPAPPHTSFLAPLTARHSSSPAASVMLSTPAMHYLPFALRAARSQAGFSALIVFIVALTTGSATAVFSLLDAALLRPFPYRQPDRLVRLENLHPRDKGAAGNVSLYDFEDYRRRARSLSSAAAYMSWSNPLTGAGPARSVRMTFVSSGIFEMLGAQPVLGRVFHRSEDVYGGPVLKAVIGYGLWQQIFGGQSHALGKTIQLRGQPYEVIGVMPPGFGFPDRAQVWVPLMARYGAYKDEWWKRRDARVHQVIARLGDGVSLEQANAEISSIAAALRQEHPEQNLDAHARLLSLREAETSAVRPYLGLVSGAALLLLALGCLNVAGLLVARAASRERETAVRLALGAHRRHLVAQLLADALLLSLAGAALGAGLAWAAIRIFLRLLPADVPGWMRLELDYRVLAFAVAAAVVTAVVSILLPSAHQFRANLNDVLKQGMRGSSGGGALAAFARRGLVVAQLALSLVLLAGAGLMVRSFQKAMSTDPGLRPDNLLVVESGRFVPNVTRHSAVAAYSNVYRRLQLALSEISGVLSASAAGTIPFMGKAEMRPQFEIFTLRRATRDQAFHLPMTGADILPGYFATMGIPLLEGRDFNENDGLDAPPVLIISKRTAEALFPGQNAVGQKIRFGIDQDYDPWSTVIGVVGNIRVNAAEREPGHEIYWSYRQYPGPGFRFVIRTASDPMALAPVIRAALQSTDPDTSIERVATMQSLMAESVWQRRLWGAVLTAFAAVALLLSLTGLYGVISHSVAQRRKEIGIRMAIGARSSQVLVWVLRGGLAIALSGAALGLAIALPLSRLLGDLLFGISAYDLPAYLASVAAMVLAGVAASIVPALRASRSDPVLSLRQDG